MKKMMGQNNTSMLHFFIYGLAFLILWEWLRPIPTVTNTGHIHVFVWFALFSSILIYLRTVLYIMIPALFAGSIYGLHYIFSDTPFFSKVGGLETTKFFASDALYNIRLIFKWELAGLTDNFRTFLLFLLLALICYLLYYWIFHTKKIFFFLLSTVIYITVLDTFTLVDASMAIIRIFVIGFFIMTLLHMLSIQEEERSIGKREITFFSTAWMYTLIFMILIATSIGYAGPKYDPQWSDPVPAIQRYFGQEGGLGSGGVRRVGYGENDERLGGGFIQDHGTVFYAETEEALYWRGESKHEYTGHGWISEPQVVDSFSIFEDAVDYYMFSRNVEVDEQEVRITMADGVKFDHLFYPGQLIDLDQESLAFELNGRVNPSIPLTFMTDILSGKISVEIPDNDDRLKLLDYTLTYEKPKFPLERIMNSSEDDPETIQNRYLQLPDTLPERVIKLAEEIVSEHDNRYDKAKAVEQYFSKNEFEYRTTEIPSPGEGEDYVDQFLFETQFGYCDNYSTSMAVLLRAVDIPTRWVKGFTQGERVENLGDGIYRYEIANSNAHSWVEVYFPEVGWVPFEPTSGFSNNVEFYEEEDEIDTDTDPSGNEEEGTGRSDLDDVMPPFEDQFDLEAGAGGSGGSGSNFTPRDWFNAKTILISIVVIFMVMSIYRKQNRIQNHFFLVKYRLLGKDERFAPAYNRLLKILDNEGIPLMEGETLREYAKRVDRILNSMAMASLTGTYEKIYYGGKVASGDWSKQRKDWEELVKALSQ